MSNWSRKNFKENGLLQGDMALWMVFILLCIISIVEVYSATSSMSYNNGPYWGPVMRHASLVTIGVIIAWFMSMLPCKFYKILSLGITFLAYITLLWATVSGRINGAARWVGFGELTFQPSELAKLGLVSFTAFILSAFRDKNGVTQFGFNIAAINICLTLLLIVTENLSTAAIIFVVMFLMCFYAQAPAKWLAGIIALIVVVAALGVSFAYSIPESKLDEWRESTGPMHRVPTWVHRITDHQEEPEDPKDYDIMDNLQVTHAHIAIGTSGFLGCGPGNSTERDYLPQAFSDFIYAIIIEEGGLLEGGFVMFLYLLLLYRAMRIAQRCKSLFPAYLIMGLALMIVTQAMINMAVAVGAMPVTGQPLPLISRGGTSTFVNCAYIGMMLSVSRSARKVGDNFKAPAEIPETVEEKPEEKPEAMTEGEDIEQNKEA